MERSSKSKSPLNFGLLNVQAGKTGPLVHRGYHPITVEKLSKERSRAVKLELKSLAKQQLKKRHPALSKAG